MPPTIQPGPLRAVVFDLFDTLVDEDRDRLPQVEVLGTRIHCTHSILHEVIAEHADIDFDTDVDLLDIAEFQVNFTGAE